jgi:hypothetical protein
MGDRRIGNETEPMRMKVKNELPMVKETSQRLPKPSNSLFKASLVTRLDLGYR